MSGEMDKDGVPLDVDRLIEKYVKKPGGLIPLLLEIQGEMGYLPREILEKVASGMNLSLAKVLGVVTFYHQFNLKPRGESLIKICMGTACHVRGASKILEVFEKELKIKAGETTKDLAFTLEQVSCVGACGLAPVLVIDDKTHGKVTPSQVPKILAEHEKVEVLH